MPLGLSCPNPLTGNYTSNSGHLSLLLARYLYWRNYLCPQNHFVPVQSWHPLDWMNRHGRHSDGLLDRHHMTLPKLACRVLEGRP